MGIIVHKLKKLMDSLDIPEDETATKQLAIPAAAIESEDNTGIPLDLAGRSLQDACSESEGIPRGNSYN
jgi:hypothetical protein